MLTSLSEQSTPGAIVDEVGVDPAALLGELDPPGLGDAEVGAFADDPGAQLGRRRRGARRWPGRRRRRGTGVDALT